MTTEVNTETLFERAAKVFDGWTDPDTGMRVLRVWASNLPRVPGMWSTFYHQYRCFLNGGRTVLLHGGKKLNPDARFSTYAVDLAAGTAEPFTLGGGRVVEVFDETQMALLISHPGHDSTDARAILWDMRADKEVASVATGEWKLNSVNFLGDGRRALVFMYRGQIYHKEIPVQSRHYLLEPGQAPRLVMEADGYFCSHIVAHPTDPDMYTYDRWLSPPGPLDQAITIRALDGSFEEPVKLDENAPRPADMWGARDHYVWAPDGSRIVSYLCTHPIDFIFQPDYEFNHFEWQWWLSALDWRTGEDYAAPYPPGRWGGHMGITPDSQYILCCGGPGFDKLFAVSIAELKHGWNEHVICSYPTTVSVGKNSDPFPMPYALPDGSGVIFNAGWPGDEYGVYLAEWPAKLK
ncbi:MAG: hypothetical protein ACYDCO_11980 [Armatimonadota bacterium]